MQASQALNRLKELNNSREGGLVRPFGGFVTSASPQKDTMRVEFFGGERSLPIHHPFDNFSSWIRGMPNPGIGVLMQYRSDTGEIEVSKYLNPRNASRIKAYDNQDGAFRPLQPGEIDVGSAGLAQAFFARRGTVDIRGGLLKMWLVQDELESGQKAPLHRRVLHTNKSDSVGSEERFGIVKRPKTATTSQYPLVEGKPAREYFMQFSDANGDLLIDKREGHVIGDSGLPLTLSETGSTLRFQHTYYTSNSTEHKISVDTNGNYVQSFPADASVGRIVTIPSGSDKRTIGLNDILNVKANRDIQVGGDQNVTVGGQYVLKSASKVVITAPAVSIN